MDNKKIHLIICIIMLFTGFVQAWNNADFDGNGVVDHIDLMQMSQTWQAMPGDFNYDMQCDLAASSRIDFNDFAVFAREWHKESIAPDSIMNPGFESGTFEGWRKTGTAFGYGPFVSDPLVTGKEGAYYASSLYNDIQSATGTLTSAPFKLRFAKLSFYIAGYNHLPRQQDPNDHYYVALKRASDHSELGRVYAPMSNGFKSADIYAPGAVGANVYIQIVDDGDEENYAWIAVDNFYLEDVPTNWGFEIGDFSGWKTSGNAFGNVPISSGGRATGNHGIYWAESRVNGEAATGILTSDDFELTEQGVGFMIAGWNHWPELQNPNDHCYAVLKRSSDDAELDRVYAPQQNAFAAAVLSSPEDAGSAVYIKIVDDGYDSAYAWLSVDFVVSITSGGFDFESNSYDNWAKTGTAFGSAPGTLAHGDMAENSWQGEYFADSHAGGQSAVGTLSSVDFRLTRYGVSFLIAGWNYYPGVQEPNEHNYVVLKRVGDDAELDRVWAPNKDTFVFANLSSPNDVNELVYIQVVDDGDEADYAWLAVDHFGAELYLRDFGSLPDDEIDDTLEINFAISMAKANSPCVLVLDAGIYDLSNSITINEAEDVTIHGDDGFTTTLRQNEFETNVTNCHKCDNIRIADFVIESSVRSFTQGTISDLNMAEKSFTFTIDSGYRELDDEFFNSPDFYFGTYQYADSAERGRVPDNVWSYAEINSWIKVSPGVYRVYVTNTTNVEDGFKFIYLRRGKWINNSSSNGSGEIHYERLRIHSGSGGGFGAVGMGKVFIDDCDIMYKPGTTDRITTNSDGAFIQSCAEGPVITNCLFEGMADDAVNVCGIAYRIYGKTSSTRYQIYTVGRPFYLGDSLRAFRRSTGLFSSHDVTVTAIHGTTVLYGVTCYDISVDPAPGFTITAGENEDAFFDNDYRGNYFMIANNTFRNLRGRGMCIRASNGTISGNDISHVSGKGILVSNYAEGELGLRSEYVTIEDNIITNVGRQLEDSVGINTGAISVMSYKVGGIATQLNFHNNILINNNEVYNWTRHAIFVSTGTNIEISSNVLQNDGSGPGPDSGNMGSIFIGHCQNVDIINNDIVDIRAAGYISGQIFRTSTGSGDVTASGNSWFTPNWTGDELQEVSSY